MYQNGSIYERNFKNHQYFDIIGFPYMLSSIKDYVYTKILQGGVDFLKTTFVLLQQNIWTCMVLIDIPS